MKKKILTRFLTPLIISIIILIINIQLQGIKSMSLFHITQENFDEIIEKTEYVFIMLHEPNSQKSEDATYEIEESAKKINNENIVFGIVEKSEENSEILKKIGPNEYPKIILFYRGHQIPYGNSILTENIDTFVNMKINTEIKSFRNFEEIKQYRKRKETVLFIGDINKKDENYLNFLRICKTYDDIIFGECHSQDCMEHYDTFSGVVSIYNGFSNEIFNIDKYNTNQLSKFVRENTKNIYPTLEKEAADIIFNKYSAGIFLFYNENAQKEKKFIFPFTSVAKHLKHSIHIVIAEFQSPMGSQVAEILKLKKEDCPKVFIIDSRKEEIQLYKLNKDITEENIYNFVIEWGLKKLTPLYFSEEIPEVQTYPIMTLVGKNYNEIVIDSPYDIIVYYLKPDCKPCKLFEEKLRKIANVIIKEYKDSNKSLFLKFGKINGELNDIEKVSILNYPAVNYYKKDNKAKPIKYEINDFDILKIVKFIAENNGDIDYEKIVSALDLTNEDSENFNANVNNEIDKKEENAQVEVNYVKNDI